MGCTVLEGPDYVCVSVWPPEDSLLHDAQLVPATSAPAGTARPLWWARQLAAALGEGVRAEVALSWDAFSVVRSTQGGGGALGRKERNSFFFLSLKWWQGLALRLPPGSHRRGLLGLQQFLLMVPRCSSEGERSGPW